MGGSACSCREASFTQKINIQTVASERCGSGSCCASLSLKEKTAIQIVDGVQGDDVDDEDDRCMSPCCCRDTTVKEKINIQTVDEPAEPQQLSKQSTGKHSEDEHPEGQMRGELVTKAGGFSLKNLACLNPGRIEHFYQVDKGRLGQGAYGVVRKATVKLTKLRRAVKSIPKKNINIGHHERHHHHKKDGNDGKDDERKKIHMELEIMRSLDHPNICRLYETFEDEKTVYLILEFCKGGELFDRILKAGHFDEQKAALSLRQMLLAMNYLHQNSILHRDVKPENWLVASAEPIEKSTIKLIDFGNAKILNPEGWAYTIIGTPNYVAPEVFSHKYNEKCDIWSLGVILYLMLSGLQPFNGKTPQEVMDQVKRASVFFDAKPWKKISHDTKCFVKSLLEKDIEVRPSAMQSLTDEWLEKTCEKSLTQHQVSEIELDRLRKFSDMSKLKKAALTVVAANLPDDRIGHMRSMFRSLDKNLSGTVCLAELREVLEQQGITIPSDLHKIFELSDSDGSGVLDYTEFLAATMDRKYYNQEEAVWQAFQKFDIDNNGSISLDELRETLHDDVENIIPGKSDHVERLFKRADKNHNGRIEYDEFLALIRQGEETSREADLKGGKEMVWDISPGNSPSTSPKGGASPRSPKGKKVSPRGEKVPKGEPRV